MPTSWSPPSNAHEGGHWHLASGLGVSLSWVGRGSRVTWVDTLSLPLVGVGVGPWPQVVPTTGKATKLGSYVHVGGAELGLIPALQRTLWLLESPFPFLKLGFLIHARWGGVRTGQRG